MKKLQLYSLAVACLAWVSIACANEPQLPIFSSENFVQSVLTAIDDKNEQELREYVVALHQVLVQATANFKFIYEQQQKEINFLREQNEKLASKQGE